MCGATLAGVDRGTPGVGPAPPGLPDLPLLEDDLDAPGVIHPAEVIEAIDMPSRVVLCFFSEVLDAIAARPDCRELEVLVWAHGRHPLYEVEHRGHRLAVVHPGVGAPLAAGILEEVIGLGGREFVTVGGAGALVGDLAMGHPIVVDSAVRDEGTSLHYAPPGRVIATDPQCVASVERTLAAAGVESRTGRAWTTDGVYRETRARVERRVAEGCIAVDMEAAALLAVAQYRGVRMAPLLYAGDSLAGEKWDHREWYAATSLREALFWLAADAALDLPPAAAG
jgi:uridine phosphorylase